MSDQTDRIVLEIDGLAVLMDAVRAGLPIVQSFDIMLERQKNVRFREILNEILHRVEELNGDSKIHGILVQSPPPAHIDEAVACSGAPPLSNEEMAKIEKLWKTDFGRLN